MFKVSFKNNFRKVQTFNNKVTVVTLIGTMQVPKQIWWLMPNSIQDWMYHHPSIDVTWVDNTHFRLEISGKLICSDSDTFDPVLGARIAECRAKIKLYKFLYTLVRKLMVYCFGVVYGTSDGGNLQTSILSDHHGGLNDIVEKYSALWLKESRHLGKLLESA